MARQDRPLRSQPICEEHFVMKFLALGCRVSCVSWQPCAASLLPFEIGYGCRFMKHNHPRQVAAI
jgi:hypothetical protein